MFYRFYMQELDLHGMKLHEAEGAVIKFIDRLYFEGELSCRIVHGLGVIATNLPTWLRSYPYVHSFERDSFNSGTTLVRLESR